VDLLLKAIKVVDNLFWAAVLDRLVLDFFVPIKTEVVALFDDLSFRYAETLGSARTLAFVAGTLLPARRHVGQVVLRVLVIGQRCSRTWPELVVSEQRGALVVQAPAVGGDVVLRRN